MTTELPSPRSRSLRRAAFRVAAFRVAAVLVALMLLPAVAGMLAPWWDVNAVGLSHPERDRWDMALEGCVDAIAVVALLVAAGRPRDSVLLVQYVAATAALAALVVTPFTGPAFLVTVALLALPLGAWPTPRQLWSLRSPGRPAGAVWWIAVPAAGVLLALSVGALRDQAGLPHGSDPDLNVLVTDAEHLLLLAVAGLLVGTRRPGWRTLGAASAGSWAWLGLASLATAGQPQSWGTAGGATSLAVGAGLLAATLWAPAVSATGDAPGRS